MPAIDTPVLPDTPTISPSPLGLPGFDEIEDIRHGADIDGPWIVILYNDDWHTFDDVIMILQKATGCSLEKGAAIAWEVHTRGRAICFSGTKEECDRVAAIIASIRLQVETDRA
ncbi:MAG: ATP-dependent Clp protease adaptor ClpS [Capsulimonadales bacterium]|nr:ATP-dependent Clp protease adaptor ClpS [Capsulimonadales bacterium]